MSVVLKSIWQLNKQLSNSKMMSFFNLSELTCNTCRFSDEEHKYVNCSLYD